MHEMGMHFWLHTCGDVRLFMDDFIEMGLDVIHPIQKYTMDEAEIAKAKQELIKEELRGPGLKLNWNFSMETML